MSNPVIFPQNRVDDVVCSPFIFPICLKTSLYSDCQKILDKLLNSSLLAQWCFQAARRCIHGYQTCGNCVQTYQNVWI